jgi:all-trans-8'-apo-beta-carotenal 15,15'-oxygenase
MIPKSSSKEEDHGWVLVLIWNGALKKTELVVLNAKDLSHQATLRIPIKIPHGLHGSWVDSN